MAIFLSIISSLLLVLSFPKPNIAPLAWIGLVPLFMAIERSSPKKAFGYSYLCGLIFFWGLLHWLGHVTYLGFFLLVLYLAIYFGIFGLFVASIVRVAESPRRYLFFLSIPAAWVALEYIRGCAFSGFGWGLLGYSQWVNLPIIQIADITGVYGVSFLVVVVNLAIYEALCVIRHIVSLKRRSRTTKDRLRLRVYPALASLILALFFGATVLVYGYGRLAKEQMGNTIRVAVIQGNIPQQIKWDPKVSPLIMDKYSKLTRLAVVDGPDLIIWPETSVPGWVGEDSQLVERLSKLAREIKKPILVGGPFWDKARNYSFNSAFLISGEDEIVARYDKLHLVPFGEYVPKIFSFAKRIDERVGGGHFSPGVRYTIFFVDEVSFGVLICFEDIFPGLVRRFVQNGADLMVNITNDAWFGKTGAPYQHAQASVLRAVEMRTPIVRCANTGLSCFIASTGRITSRVMDKEGVDIFTTGYLIRAISLRKGSTIYASFGDWFVYLCILISMGSGVGFFLTRRKTLRYNLNEKRT